MREANFQGETEPTRATKRMRETRILGNRLKAETRRHEAGSVGGGQEQVEASERLLRQGRPASPQSAF